MEYIQLHYDVIDAFNEGITDLPIKQMLKLGYHLIGSVPQSLGDCWWFTVEEKIEPSPSYLREIHYNFDYWHNRCYASCDYFKKDPCCCNGGFTCSKGE